MHGESSEFLVFSVNRPVVQHTAHRQSPTPVLVTAVLYFDVDEDV
jgi:hypothetical protein